MQPWTRQTTEYLTFSVSSTTLHGFAAPSVHASASEAELGTDEVGARAEFKSACRNSNALRSSSMQEFDMEVQWKRSARQWCCNGVVVSGSACCAARIWLDPLCTWPRTLWRVCLRALALPVMPYLTLCYAYACTVIDRRQWRCTFCGARSDEWAGPDAAARSFLPACIAWIDCTLRTRRQMSVLPRICGALGAPCWPRSCTLRSIGSLS